jgi:hypothetical protein
MYNESMMMYGQRLFQLVDELEDMQSMGRETITADVFPSHSGGGRGR